MAFGRSKILAVILSTSKRFRRLSGMPEQKSNIPELAARNFHGAKIIINADKQANFLHLRNLKKISQTRLTRDVLNDGSICG